VGPDDPTTVELLVTLALADEETLRRAVEVQHAAAQLGLPESLFEIIWKKKLLRERQASMFADLVALEALASPQGARTIAGYHIDARRGFAGVGVLFEASDAASGRPVLLKVLSPLVAAHREFARRFEKEVEVLARLRHPCLPRLLDSGASGDYRYFALEGGGRFLCELAEERPLPTPRSLDLAADLCRALAHLPGPHLGIKPSAVVTRPGGGWVLLDAGATPPPAARLATFPGVALADPLYGAPEVRKGAAPGPQADIYSLGATLLTAATGRLPTGRASETPEGVPQPLRRIIQKAMEDDPARRYRGPDELLAEVEEARARLSPRPVQAVGTPAPPQPPAAEKSTGVFWTALVVFLGVALAVAGVWAFYVRVLRPAPPSRRPAGSPGLPKGKPRGPQRAAQPPKPTTKRAESRRAASLAQEALNYEKAHPGQHGDVLLRLRRALLAAPEGAAAGVLEERRAARETALDAAARKAFDGLASTVAALERKDRFGDALRACGRFPAGLRFGVWAQRLVSTAHAVGAAAERRYLALATGGMFALLGRRYDEALAHYERIARLGIPWMDEASAFFLAAARPYAEAEKKRLAAFTAERARAARRAAFAPLQPHFAKIAGLVAKRDRAAALAALNAIPEELRQGERGQAVERLQTRLAAWADVWKRILDGPPTAIGQVIEVHGNKGTIEGFSGKGNARRLNLLVRVGGAQRVVSELLTRLPSQAIRELAEWSVGAMPAREAALALGLFSLTEGWVAQARGDLRDAAALGAEAGAFLEEIEATKVVEEALAAYAQKQWPRARQLLEAALDRHATAPAVVAAHSKLASALKVTLGKLGHRPMPRAFVPAPLPGALRRIPLLPETRLEVPAPPDPVVSYLGSPLVRASPVVAGFPTWRNYTVVARWRGERDADFVLAGRLSGPLDGQFRCYYLALRGNRLSLWRLDEAGHRILESALVPSLRAEGHHRLELRLEAARLSVFGDAKPLFEVRESQLSAGRVALVVERGTLLLDALEVFFHPPSH